MKSTRLISPLKALAMLVLGVTSRAAWAASVSIPASADTFINSGLPNNNAGAVTHMAAGTDGGGGVRRGLFQFNVSGIPAGATVMTAVIQMSVVNAPLLGAVDSVFDLHRVTEAWGEGTNGAIGNSGAPASPGEATWSNRLHTIACWRSAGASGDFIAVPSAATNVAGVGAYAWSGTGLVADVQFWVNNPNQNYGLILASQAEVALKTARAFGSREGAAPATLNVTYLPPVMDSNISMTMAITITNGNVTLAWPSQSNRSYDVEYCRTLTPAPNWLMAEPNVPRAASGTNKWSKPPFLASPAYTGNTALFYRIQARPDVATPLPIALDVIASNLTSPTVLTHAGDQSGRLFVAEQTGKILVLAGGTNRLATPFLDLTAKMTNLAPAFAGAPRGVNPSYDERGLLGLAFHPGYVTNRRFFVYYSSPAFGPNTNHQSILAEYRGALADPNVADTNETVLLRIAEPQFNHNGGALAFGTDGDLYVSVGDGGGAGDTNLGHGATGNGQNTQTLLGKILRLDVNAGVPYAIPFDNPFASGGGLPEIFAAGFRNPWRMSFDRAGSNTLFVADVGQDFWEEIDVVTNGGNYGWRILEGNHAFDVPVAQVLGVSIPDLAGPIHEYVHGPLGISIIGGFVYRGTQYSALAGAYVFGDFSTAFGVPNGALYYLAETRPGIWQRFAFVLQPSGGPLGRYVKGFGEGEDGELYLLSTTLIGPSGSSADIRHIRKPH